MKLGFFLGDGKEIGENAKLRVDRDGAQRAEQSCNILGSVLGLHFSDVIAGIAVFFKDFFGWAAVRQI